MWPNKWLLGRDPEHLNKFFKRNIKCALVLGGWFSFWGSCAFAVTDLMLLRSMVGSGYGDIFILHRFFVCVLEILIKLGSSKSA